MVVSDRCRLTLFEIVVNRQFEGVLVAGLGLVALDLVCLGKSG